MKRSFFEKLNIGVFIALFILPGIVGFIAFASKNAETVSNLFASLSENRALSPRPASAADTRAWEDYYNDRLPFRNVLVRADNNLESGLEKQYRKRVMPSLVRMLGLKSAATEKESVAASLKTEREDKPVTESTMQADESAPVTCEHQWEVEQERKASYTDYGRTLYVCSICGERKWDDFEDKIPDDEYYPISYAANSVLFGKYDWLFYTNDHALEYFQKKMIMDDKQKADVLAEMNRLKAACDDRGIRLVIMFAPNREQVYPEYMPTLDVPPGDNREQDLVRYVRDNSDISILYPLEELKRGNVFYDTCYRYDSHWNHWGAFVATEALYEAIGAKTVKPESVPVNEEYTMMAGLIASGALNPADYEPARDYFADYRPDAGAVVIEGEQDIAKGYTLYYEADATAPEDERKIAVIGDSFRVSMMRYIEKDFSKTVSIQKEAVLAGDDTDDPETWQKIMDAVANTDILVIESVERYDNECFDIISKLAGYLGR